MAQKSLKKNAFINVIKTFMSLVFPLITFPYASRILLPTGLGKVNFALSVISYFTLISSLGIENYGIREAAKLRDDKQKLSQFSKEIFLINIISTIIAYILLIITILFVSKLFEYRKLLFVTSATILFTTLGINWLYIALEDYFYITIRTIAFQCLSIILLFIFVKNEEDYVVYAAISVVSSVGSNLLNFVHSKKYISIKLTNKCNFHKHIKPIFVLFSMAIAVKIYTVLDTTMLGFIKGDWDVGIYTAATKINKIVLTLVLAITSVFIPRLSYYANQKDKLEFNRLAYKGFDILLLIAIPCTIGLSVLSKPIVHVFCGEEYFQAVLPMIIMNPIVLIIGISSYIGINIFLSVRKEIYKLYSSVAGAIINLLLNLLLIPKLGCVGAAISTLIAELGVTIVQLLLVKNILTLGPVLKSFIVYLLNSLIMIIPVYICCILINDYVIQLFVGILLGVTVYFVLLLFQKNTLLYEIISRRVKDEK